MIDDVAPVNDFYGDSLTDEFGPLKLKTLRQHLVEYGLCRAEINKRIGRIKRVFKRAVSEELIPPSVHEGLRTVTGLMFGRTSAHASEPVKPIDERFVEETLSFVCRQVFAVAQLQVLTEVCPGEVGVMRPRDINRDAEVRLYEPEDHKNRWRGHRRVVPFGPRPQDILMPFIDRPDLKFLFSPALVLPLQSAGVNYFCYHQETACTSFGP